MNVVQLITSVESITMKFVIITIGFYVLDDSASVDAELAQLADGDANGEQTYRTDVTLDSPAPSLAISAGDYGREPSVAGSVSDRSTLLR